MSNTKIDKNIKSPKFIIALTIITTIIVACFSLSKYESTLAGKSETTIALMANSIKANLTDTGKPRRHSYI